MSSAFPASHTTHTATTTVTSSDDRKLYINSGFLKTQHGQLKMIQIVLCLLAFICVMSSGYPYNSISEANFSSFVTVCGLLTSGILLFLYFINAVVYFTSIPWVLIELIYTGLWTFFTFVAATVDAVAVNKYTGGNVANAAAAFFLYCAMCVYGYSAFKLFLLHRQGVRLVIVTTETMTTTTSRP